MVAKRRTVICELKDLLPLLETLVSGKELSKRDCEWLFKLRVVKQADTIYSDSVAEPVSLSEHMLEQLVGVAPLLIQLDLRKTGLEDVSPIARLTCLQDLKLNDTQVNNLRVLSGLLHLQKLNVSGTQVSDLSPLTGLPNLQELDISITQIRDLTPLTSLPKLQELDFSGTPVQDISPLARLSNLNYLRFNDTQVNDLSPLAGLSQLKKLSFHNTLVNNLSPLAGLSQLQEIHFSRTAVTDFNPLAGLSQLQALHFSDLSVNDFSPLARLTQIRVLNCMCTQVCDLSFLAGMTKLRILLLDSTQVQDLRPLAKLKQLMFLSLDNTQVRDLSPLAELAKLEFLNLDNTQVRDLSPLAGLRKLHELSLCGLLLDTLPRFCLRNSANVRLENTQFSRQPAALFRLPKEDVLQTYYDANRVTVNEGKVIFLGEGGVGKTHTILRIRERGKQQEYKTETTPGVSILPFDCGNGFRIRFWDFGGQEIMHSMHRCFLTERSCYVVVVSNRVSGSAMKEARKWLRTVAGFSQQVSVLLAVNQWNGVSEEREIDVAELKKICPTLADVVFYSARDDNEEDFNRRLTERIEREVTKLDSVKLELPESWAAIREKLTALTETRTNYITLEDYREICAQCGLGGEDEASESIRLWLLEWFNDLGICFSYHKNAPADAEELRKYKVLNPLWLTNGIYRIINNGHNLCSSGLLGKEDVCELLNSNRFLAVDPSIQYKDEEEQNYILEVMRKLGRSFPTEEKKEFIPETLSVIRPEHPGPLGFGEPLVYSLKLTYLPLNLLHRLMIAMFPMNDGVIWRKGIRLCGDSSVLLVEAADDKMLLLSLYQEQRASPSFCALFHEARERILQYCQDMRLVIEDEKIRAVNGTAVAEYSLPLLLQAWERSSSASYPSTSGDLRFFTLNELLFPLFPPDVLGAARELLDFSDRNMQESLNAVCAVYPFSTIATIHALPDDYLRKWREIKRRRFSNEKSLLALKDESPPLLILGSLWLRQVGFRTWLKDNGVKTRRSERSCNPMLERRRIIGINRDLYQWAERSALYQKAVGSTDSRQELLAKALDPNEAERYRGSFALMQAIWHSCPELGLAPDYALMAEKEHDRVFFPKYRDHLTHMFKVFLLGLFLYENYQEFQEALPEEDVFLPIWTLTSLYHDIGYLIETEDGCWGSEAGQFVLERFNTDLALPMTQMYPQVFGKGTEKGYQERDGIYPPKANGQTDVERMLDAFQGFGTSVQLFVSDEANPIKTYYSLVSRLHSSRVYYDHGIVSACLLLFMRDGVDKYMNAFEGKKLAEKHAEKRDAYLKTAKMYNEYTIIAARAIALHNIMKDWGETDIAEFNRQGVTIGEFCISLEKDPFAYLLRLCDELQCWDRQYYTSPLKSGLISLEPDKLSLHQNTSCLSVSILDEVAKSNFISALSGLLSPPVELVP